METVLAPLSPSEPKGRIGEHTDPETGLTYLHARYYDAALGRFLSPDWWDVSDPGVGTDRYGYSLGDPVNKSDANGHSVDSWFLEVTGQTSGSYAATHVRTRTAGEWTGSNYFATDDVLPKDRASLMDYKLKLMTSVGVFDPVGYGPVRVPSIFGLSPAGGVAFVFAGSVAAARAKSNAELVQAIADRADAWGARNGLGVGPVVGIHKHGYADRLLARYQATFGDLGLSTEVRYVNQQPWRPGQPVSGSIRLDVVEGPLANPTAIYDYKFGNSTLTPRRELQIRAQIGIGVQIVLVKP